MKYRLIGSLAAATATFFWGWLVGAYISLEPNVFDWPTIGRAAHALMSVLAGVLLATFPGGD